MNENENAIIQNMWDIVKSSAKGKVHSNTGIPQETRKKSNNLTHSSVLAWRIPGMGEPGELPSMGSHRVRHN